MRSILCDILDVYRTPVLFMQFKELALFLIQLAQLIMTNGGSFSHW